MKRTDEEIQAALEALENNKKACRKTDAFGGDNHAKLDATIDVIKNRLTDDQIYDKYPPEQEGEEDDDLGIEGDQDLYDAAWSGKEYLNGQSEVEDLIYPVD